MPKRKNFQGGDGPEMSSGPPTPRPVLRSENPAATHVSFPPNHTGFRRFDFGPWYDGRIDAITRACHQAVAAMIDDSRLSSGTIVNYCRTGLDTFLPFCQTWASTLNRPLLLEDIDRTCIDHFLLDLKSSAWSIRTQKHCWDNAKSVLTRCVKSGWIDDSGDLLPKNPYPGSSRTVKGQKALSKAERRRVVAALKTDLQVAMEGSDPFNRDELALCMLAIAARSGMNPTPLVELPTNCLQPHPLKANRKLLVSYKRRGNSTHIQALRKSGDIELVKTVLPDVEHILDAVIRRNASIRARSAEYADRLFVYESRQNQSYGTVTAFNLHALGRAISAWCRSHDLGDDDGAPLKLNVMRLRKTFENRIWELSGQDPWVTAKLAGHSLKVSNDHYLEVPEEAEKDFRFLGEALTQELLAQPKVRSLPAENTPVSKCRDTLNGQFAPKASSEHCTNFLACVRCRSFVVTEDDLWRLYSFYWLLVSERDLIGSRKWSRYYAHIIRIIDRDIAPQFDAATVDAVRQRAKEQPHTYWQTREKLEAAV